MTQNLEEVGMEKGFQICLAFWKKNLNLNMIDFIKIMINSKTVETSYAFNN